MGRAFPQCAFECVPLDFLSAWSALSNERTEKAYRLRVTWCAGSMTSCRQRLFRTLHDGEFLVKTHWDLKNEISQITDQGEKKSPRTVRELCVQMDFTRTFEANAKCNNINYVWSHFYQILVVLKYHGRLSNNSFDNDISRRINIPKNDK